MGCFSSKARESPESEHSTEHAGPIQKMNAGRVGIMPIISISSSDSSSSLEVRSSSSKESSSQYKLVEKLAVGARGYKDRIQVQEISEDESSAEQNENAFNRDAGQFRTPDGNLPPSSPSVSFSWSLNQSMDDMEDESVVDWLAESSEATLFTSTTSLGDETRRRRDSASRGAADESPSESRPDLNAILVSPKNTARHSSGDGHVVKDTNRVERRHAPLPCEKPAATKGEERHNIATSVLCRN